MSLQTKKIGLRCLFNSAHELRLLIGGEVLLDKPGASHLIERALELAKRRCGIRRLGVECFHQLTHINLLAFIGSPALFR